MRVFILQKSNKYDVSAAAAYGKLIYLIDEKDYLPPFDPDKVIRYIRAELNRLKFDPNRDAIALTGSSILISLFLSVLIYDHVKVKTLLFDARDRKYKLVITDLSGEH